MSVIAPEGRSRTAALALVIAVVFAPGLGGCGSSAHSAATPSLPVAVPPTGSDDSAGDAASPTPTPVPFSVAVVKRFVDFAVRSHPSYHVALSGRFFATISAATLTGSVDVSGLDVATTTNYAFEDARLPDTTVRTIWAQRAAYLKVGSGAWQRIAAGFGAATVVDPFGGADAPGTVTFVGARTVNGQTLSTLTVTAGRLFDLTTIPAPNLSEEQVRFTTWTLVVDEVGRPVSGTYRLDGVGRVGSQLQQLVVELNATFSKVGSAITIQAP